MHLYIMYMLFHVNDYISYSCNPIVKCDPEICAKTTQISHLYVIVPVPSHHLWDLQEPHQSCRAEGDQQSAQAVTLCLVRYFL